MRIFVMMGLSLMVATVVAAQERHEPSQTQPTEPTTAIGSTTNEVATFRAALTSLHLPATALFPATAQQPAAPPRPATRPTVARRRGSMVGYIDDATVESKVRVRFDAAGHNTAPDRAEFFYAKCGCYQDLVGTPFHDPDAPGPAPAIATDIDFSQLDIRGEYAFGGFASVFVQLPVRWLRPQAFFGENDPGFTGGFIKHSGLSDLRTGVKAGFSPAANHTVTAQAQFVFPTGDASKGLGTDHASIEPAVLYNWQASDIVVVESQLAVLLPFGGSAGLRPDVDEDFSGRILIYGVGSGLNLFQRGEILAGPVVELVGWHVMSGFTTVGPPDVAIEASGINIVNLKIGGRIEFDVSNSVYVGWGKALTDATWYDDIWRLEYRFSF